ncbi:glycosyltransferase [Anaerosoma tenue]|uniref:glycosyltransferase n=1 Tax=Anaerosoma tenue TaxID=2933588 RepID=UPI002260D686|nr:glycosyltransferase [Anaerosoma tenue]MCK8114680.1 glycosyltransferase [Anaerosoma tenue]
MRITMLNKYYPPHLGGIEYHMRDLAVALSEAGHGVHVIVANEGPEGVFETLDGVAVTRLPRLFAYASTPVAPGMKRAIAEEAARPDRPDVFHLHFPYPWGEVSWLAARGGRGALSGWRPRSDVPTVLTYHSDIVRQKVLGSAYAPLLRRVLDRVDLVIASSPDMVEHSEYLAPVASKCRVVPFGIHVERFAATPERTTRAAELRTEGTPSRGERPVVLFVGRLIYYKGADVLVRAMAEVDADLVMIGSGPLRAELDELVSSLGIEDRVRFTDPVGDDELAAWYHAADVFCLPSVARSEAFGLVQLEAHAAGTPVVSTRLTTGVPFVNQHGVTGLTVPPGDARALAEALHEIVSDDALRVRLGAQAAERAARDFTIARMVADTRAVYDEARGGV